MTPEQQRIAIAKACGWHSFRDIGGDGETRLWGMSKEMKHTSLPTQLVPNYHGDLNAMHEAEKVLEDADENGRLMANYATWILPSVCDAYRRGHERSVAGSTTAYWVLHATAAQRAEAFLKTLGLWEESKP